MTVCVGCSNQLIVSPRQRNSGDNRQDLSAAALAKADKQYKDDLIKIAKRVYQRGLIWGTGGDISVRIPHTDRFIIKATGQCFGDLDYDKIVTVGLDGRVFEGSARPSHEANIHCALYNLHDNLGAIMHIHSPYATAWATTGKKVPAVTQQSVTILKDAGLVPYYPPGSKELLDAVVNCYKNPETSIVLMENHGAFIVGADLYGILYKAEVLEETARVAYFCLTIGPAKEFSYQKPLEYTPP